MEHTSAPLAYPVPDFCRAHNLSTSAYYELKKIGRAPREMRLGRKVLISAEAAADWRRAIETDPVSSPVTPEAA